jgi:hypothetical protein
VSHFIKKPVWFCCWRGAVSPSRFWNRSGLITGPASFQKSSPRLERLYHCAKITWLSSSSFLKKFSITVQSKWLRLRPRPWRIKCVTNLPMFFNFASQCIFPLNLTTPTILICMFALWQWDLGESYQAESYHRDFRYTFAVLELDPVGLHLRDKSDRSLDQPSTWKYSLSDTISLRTTDVFLISIKKSSTSKKGNIVTSP